MTTNTMPTIGCDLGDRFSEMCLLDDKGALEYLRVATTKAAMAEFFERPATHVILEAGTHSHWVSRLCAERGHRVTVANPRRVQLIAQSYAKSDRSDAQMLARIGRADVELLSPVEHRGEALQTDLAVVRARDGLVQVRTRLVNSVRGLAKSFGLRLPKCTTNCFHNKARPLIPQELLPALEPLLQTLEHVDEQLKQYDGTLIKMAKRYPDTEVVSQPSGVGIITSLVFVLTLADKRRFEKSRMVGAYVGLKPKRDQSGDVDKQLPITKAGDIYLRRLLVSSANFILGPFGQDSDLRRWGLALAERGGKNGRKRAKVAVARKLAVLMHRLWVTGEIYQPLGYRMTQAA